MVPSRYMKIILKALTRIGVSIAVLFVIVASAWAVGALAYDGLGLWFGILMMLAVLASMIWFKFRLWSWVVWGVFFIFVLSWWLLIDPPRGGNWQPEVAQIASAESSGDIITISNIRDFEYRTESDFDSRWTTRKIDLSKITGVDIALNYWGSPWIAHPIVSFQFSDSPPLCFSIEARKTKGQKYSAIGGFYRQFTLVYIVAEERDILGVRAVHRKGEDVYLYRTTLTPAQARIRLLEYLSSINDLASKPRWYNAITTNCTTSIRSQHLSSQRLPLDWRILINGKGDEMMYEYGLLVTDGLSFPELKRRAHANAAIINADGKPGFSSLIRSNPSSSE
jgi:hypothetical protein